MIKIKSFAIVSKLSGDVVGRYVVPPGQRSPGFGHLKLAYMVDGEVSSCDVVYISHTKGNMSRLEKLCKKNNSPCCIIIDSSYDYDLLMLVD